MMKLSIIIPVYNVEKYLAKCLDSILVDNAFTGQVVCVNDGSTDGSAAILEDYGKKYSNVEIITQPNGGLSAARNAGLKIANGEYLCFVDSDDYWEPNVLGRLMEQVERENLDVLRFDYQNVRIADGVQCKVYGVKYEAFEPNKTPRYIDRGTVVVDGETYLNTRMGYACYAVMYIMRKAIVPTFTEGIHYEDVDWLPRMMMRADRVNSTTTIVYNYLIRQGSITKAQGDKTKIRKNLEDRLQIVDKYRQYREQYPECNWLYNMQSRMVEGSLTTMACEFYNERREYITRLRKTNVFPLSITNGGWSYTRRAKLINRLGPHIYCILMYVKQKL